MVEYKPILNLRDSIKRARGNIEKDEFDSAINLYRKTVLEFLWIVRSIKTIDNITVIDNIFTFYKSLGNILKNLHDPDRITLMNRLQYSLYDLTNKIPPDKPEVAKRLNDGIFSIQNYAMLEQTREVYETSLSMMPMQLFGANSKKTVTEEEKSSIFESSEELEKALTEIEELGRFEDEEKS